LFKEYIDSAKTGRKKFRNYLKKAYTTYEKGKDKMKKSTEQALKRKDTADHANEKIRNLYVHPKSEPYLFGSFINLQKTS